MAAYVSHGIPIRHGQLTSTKPIFFSSVERKDFLDYDDFGHLDESKEKNWMRRSRVFCLHSVTAASLKLQRRRAAALVATAAAAALVATKGVVQWA